jgi:putative CocE/NonD family hydrolase
MKKLINTIIFSTIIIWSAAPVLAEDSGFENWAEMEKALVKESIRRQWVPMRDGVRLDANIFLPKAGEAPYPTVLIRSPYPDEIILDGMAGKMLNRILLEQGFAIMFQNERGRYWSEGDYNYLARAGEDGYDTIDWVSKQPWSNGKVGTIGCSSSAENQLALSVAAHPAHAAAIAQAPGAGIGRIGPYAEQGNMFRGGVPQLLFAGWYFDYVYYGSEAAAQRPRFPSDLSQEDRVRLSKFWKLWPNYGWGKPREGFDYHEFFSTLPVSDLMIAADGPVTNWNDFIQRTPHDSAWEDTHFSNEGDEFGVPMLWMFSWYDISVAPNAALYNYARENTSTRRARDNQFMVIGPMPHCQFGEEVEETVVGERNLGDARFDYDTLYVEWFSRWLKGEKNDVLARPKVQYYQMGANEWVSGERFPLKGSRVMDLYIGSTEGANSLYGDGTLSTSPPEGTGSDVFIYDPMHPVPTYGGGACCMGDVKATGALNQADLEIRNDVLVYSSPVLDEDLPVAGFIEIELYVSSDAKDTDFTVKLVDVDPDGIAYNLDDNIFRARYREGYDRKVLMEEGEIYKISFAPMITANTFKKGHQIRVEISSSNFPRYGRNMNTGGDNYDEATGMVAHNQVHHSPAHPSRIRLQVK